MSETNLPLALGIDVGGTRTKLGWVSPNGETLAQGDFATPSQDPPEVLVDRCLEEAERLWSSVPPHAIRAGVGIGIPNACEETGEVINPPHLAWGRVPLKELWSRACSLPLVICNDANAAVLGEYCYGRHRGSPNILSVTIGTGLGSGLSAGNHLITGANGLAPELGHIPVPPGDRVCACGRCGCLETYVSESGVLRTYREQGGKEKQEGHLTARDLSLLARKGDPLALAAWRYTGEQLALGLCPAILLAGPAHIVLSGGVSMSGDLLLKPALSALERLVMPHFLGSFTVELSALDPRLAGILGAAASFWRKQGHRPLNPSPSSSV